jgi:hypothetical protein
MSEASSSVDSVTISSQPPESHMIAGSSRQDRTLLMLKLIPLPDTNDIFDISVHALPKRMAADVTNYTVTIDPETIANVDPSCALKVIIIMLKSNLDLIRIGPDIEDEKNRLLEVYLSIARRCVEILSSRGYWVEYLDPCSGLPVSYYAIRLIRPCQNFKLHCDML